jgi:hypothetical protein
VGRWRVWRFRGQRHAAGTPETRFPLFSASFLAAAISMLVGTLDKNAPRMEGAGVMSAIIVIIAALFVFYTWWLSRRDVLR